MLTVRGKDVAPHSTKGWAESVILWGEHLEWLGTLLSRAGVWLCHRKYLPALHSASQGSAGLLHEGTISVCHFHGLKKYTDLVFFPVKTETS